MAKQGPGKGNTNNPNGRPKGIPNKITNDIKQKVSNLLDQYSIEDMTNDLKSLEPLERLRVITGLLNYAIPRIQHNINEETKPIVIKGITFDK